MSTFVQLILINILFTIINTLNNSTNSTIAPTLSPTINNTNITTTTPSPTLSPTLSPTYSPTNSSLNTTLSPTNSPTSSPTSSPTYSPTYSPTITKLPTFAPSIFGPFTTKEGKDITPTQQLFVNFTANFTSSKVSTWSTMEESLKLAYSAVGIPANYIEKNDPNPEHSGPHYFYKVRSIINAKDETEVNNYQAAVSPDPDGGPFPFRIALAAVLNQTLNYTVTNLDLSIIHTSKHSITTSDGSSTDTTQIIIWFLGVSAVCAIGALVLIICWRKFSGKDENENDNAINLEFLLDPNATNDPNLLTSPMHINDNHDDNDKNINNNQSIYHSLQPEDFENDDDLKPIKQKKIKIKKKYFNRLQDDDDIDNDKEYEQEEDEQQQQDDDDEEEEEEYEEYDQDDQDENYAPPSMNQFSERL